MSSSPIQASSSSLAPDSAAQEFPSWQIKLLYDGQCPLCLKEVNFLKRRDGDRGRIAFVDIAEDDYLPEVNGGVSYEDAMGVIHAVLPDGTIIQNLEVFRRIYAILGMGWVFAITQWPIIGPIADWVYGVWAKWRLPLTGRPSLDAVIRDRQKRLGIVQDCQTEGRCRL